MDKLIEKVGQGLGEFLAKHRDETFYVLAVDAGSIALNTVEHLDRKMARAKGRWEEQTKPVTLDEVRDLDEDDLDDYSFISYHMRKGCTLEEGLKAENENRQEEREEGSPYDDPQSNEVQRLRWGPGNFAYAELVNLDLHDEYREHYDLDKTARGKSRYQAKVTLLLAELAKHKESVFRDAKLTDDFRMLAAEHEY